MNRQRFEELLDRAGSAESSWPADELDGIRTLLKEDAQARSALHAARRLDHALDAFQPPLPDLSAHIMAAIPRSAAERLVGWLFPGGGSSLLRPVLACSLPLLLGTVLGLSLPAADDAAWDLQEQNLMTSAQSEAWYE